MTIARSRKGFEILTAWVELSLVGFIILGAVLGFLIRNPVISYSVLFLFSLITGALIYKNRKVNLLAYLILTAGFGFVIGSRTVSAVPLMGIFLLGNIACFYMCHRKLIKLI